MFVACGNSFVSVGFYQHSAFPILCIRPYGARAPGDHAATGDKLPPVLENGVANGIANGVANVP